jgi:hypothetical protein
MSYGPGDSMNDDRSFLPRLATAAVRRSLRVFPVTVIMGARQTGKTTLAREISRASHRYVTLDDVDVRDRARHDPHGLIAQAPRLVLDEVQRMPELLLEIKRTVDDGPRAGQVGRFILTGSADLLLMRSVTESLAGRAGYVVLWPMTRGELDGDGRCGLWSDLYTTPPDSWRQLLEDVMLPGVDWRERALVGGYPVPAYELDDATDRREWFGGYVRTYLERDLRDLAAIEQLEDFNRLMRMASLRVGNVLNQADLARDAHLSPATAHRYLNLLETSFQLVRVAPYASNRTKRLTKSPQAFWSDTGLALHLARLTEPSGGHLENLVLGDLLAWRDSDPGRPEVLYWRTYDGVEVDFVLESGGELVAVEVKATTRPRFRDTAGLRAFREAHGDLVRSCLLLHAGDQVDWLAEGVLGAPWWRVV